MKEVNFIMTNLKLTKRALLSSVVATFLCLAMLLGTTFAWFTDTVTSANNVIMSGNLDITLEYFDGKEWKDVEGASEILDPKALWEPGYTEVAYFRFENAGSLALKYSLGINIISEKEGVNAAGDTFKLSDYIYFDVIDDVNGETDAFATRAEALAEVENASKISVGYTQSGYLLADTGYQYLAMVVYMPDSVGNVANHDGKTIPQINLGVNIMATQYTSEKDSFDDQYDLAAPWIGIIPDSLDETTLEIVPGGGTKTGTITVNTAEDLVYLNKLAKEWVSLYSNGQGTNVDNYRENAGGQGTDYYYHWEWTVELAADLDMSNIPMDSVDISYWDDFEGNGHTIQNVVLKNGQDGLFLNGAKVVKNLTVKNIKVNAPEAETVGAVAGNGSMTNVHVENATVIGGKYVGGICGKGSSFVNCSIKNSTVTGNNKTVGGLVGYSIGDPNAATVTGNVVEDVTVTGAYNVGGLLGQSQNETVEGNTVKNVTVTSTLELPSNASSNEVRAAELAARSQFANTTIGANTIENVKLVEAISVSNASELESTLADAADANSGDNTIFLSGDIDLTGSSWTPISVDGYHGAGVVTIEGNGATIKGLTAPLFAGGFAGKSGIIIKNLTIADSNIAGGTQGGGAFIDCADSMHVITLENCHLVNSTVSGERAGGLIGWCSGYAQLNDGPVKAYVTIKNCSVVDSTVIGNGSAGGIAGHPGASDYTYTTIEDCLVKNVDVISYEPVSSWRTGAIVGTANNGHVVINNVTVEDVTLTQDGVTATETKLYGRFVPSGTGTLVIDGVEIH